MTGDELRAAIETLWPGRGTQARATEYMGWANSRTLRKYLSGEKPVPPRLAAEITDLLARFPNGIQSVNPTVEITELHRRMVATGFTDGQAAAAILGACLLAVSTIIGREAMMELIVRAD